MASRGPLYRAAAQDVVGDAIGSCLGMLSEAAESQRFALAVLGSAPVHGGAVAGEDRRPLECLRESGTRRIRAGPCLTSTFTSAPHSGQLTSSISLRLITARV
jgi:hypothetical protein